MTHGRLVPALLIHARRVAAHMRQADVDECRASGTTPEEALRTGMTTTPAPRAILIGDEVVAVCGVIPAPGHPRVGVLWLLGTNSIPLHGKTHTRVCRDYIASLWRDYDELVNVVHAKNEVAVRWLRWMGFCIEPATPHHATGEAFHFFHASKPDVHTRHGAGRLQRRIERLERVHQLS